MTDTVRASSAVHDASTHIVRAAGIVALTISLLGCARTLLTPSTRRPDSPAQHTLTQLATRQLESPDPHAAAFTLPLGRVAQALTPPQPSSPADRIARTPLDQLLDELLAAIPATPATQPPKAQPAAAVPDEAIRAYIVGRLADLDRDKSTAIDQLKTAAAIAPTEPRVWRALGEALRADGQYEAARDALMRAIDLGLDQPDAMFLAAIESRRLGAQPESVALLLARAARLHPARSDPALPYLINLHLGSVLLEMGALQAGDTALGKGLALPDSFPVRTRYIDELTDAAHQQASLWISMGDAMLRLGRPDQALERYRQALTRARPGTEPIPMRRILALMQLGRSAEATTVLTRTLATPQAPRDDRLIALTKAVGAIPTTADALARRLDELTASRTDRSLALDAWWARIRAAASLTQRNAILADALELDPTRFELMTDLLAHQADDPARASLAAKLASPEPLVPRTIARALIATSEHPSRIEEALTRDPDDRAALLAAWLALQRDDPQAAQRVLDHPAAALEPAWSLARVAAVTDLGAHDQALDLLDRIKLLDPPSARARALALQSMQRFDEAIQTLDAIEDPTHADLQLLSQTALAAGRVRQARSAALALHELDPFDESAIEILLGVSTQQDDPSPAALVEHLRTAMPGARLTRSLQAQQLIAQRKPASAEPILAELADGLPDPGLSSDPLLGVWEQQAQQLGPAPLERGLVWVRDRLAQHPASQGLVRAQTVLLVDLGRADEALADLETRLASDPSPALEQLRERVVRTSLRDPKRADQLAIARLTRHPRNIDQHLEYASVLARIGTLAEALVEVRELPADAQLTPNQQRSLVAILTEAARAASADPTGPARQPTLALIDLALDRAIALPEPIERLRLGLLAAGESVDESALLRSVLGAVHRHPDQTEALALSPVRALASLDRPAAALGLMRSLAASVDLDTPDAAGVWASLIARVGSPQDVTAMLDRITNRAALASLLTLAGAPASDESQTVDQLRAEVAYRLAGPISARLGRDAAMRAMELVLGYDDRHALANNDLAYYLAVRGEQLDRAETLASQAVDLLPDQANVLDTLAWVRYRAGQLEDLPAGPAGPARPGAVRLLTRAVAMDTDDPPSPTMLDHLGDALWASGDYAGARSAWTRARTAAQARLDGLRDRGVPEDALAEPVAELKRIGDKLDAVASDGQPSITPIASVHAQPATP